MNDYTTNHRYRFVLRYSCFVHVNNSHQTISQ